MSRSDDLEYVLVTERKEAHGLLARIALRIDAIDFAEANWGDAGDLKRLNEALRNALNY